MNERFLHFIWQFQKFTKKDLDTTAGEPVQVYNAGHYNENAGPDFLEATIKVGPLKWVGRVEIHVKSSDWLAHNHQHDKNYDNVILHVVWDDDKPVSNNSGERIPTIELKKRISTEDFDRYQKFINQPIDIPCTGHPIEDIYRSSMLEKTAIERMKSKAKKIEESTTSKTSDLEQISFIMLARAFGGNLNGDQFEELARNIPIKIIAKHLDQPSQIEALVFGMAGFLEEPKGAYAISLANEFEFLCTKYSLKQNLSRFQWNFHRLRPPSFPSLRLAQFSGLIGTSLFNHRYLLESVDLKGIYARLDSGLPTYWKSHYDFEKPTKRKNQGLTTSFKQHLVINWGVPILIHSSYYFDDAALREKAMDWSSQIPPENNKFTRKLVSTGFEMNSALSSQGGLHLYKEYCLKKRCLDCQIGMKILNR